MPVLDGALLSCWPGEEAVALTALRLYQLFRDPHSAYDVASRQYRFLSASWRRPTASAGTVG